MPRIMLKGGKETTDVRLDRVEQFDARSRGFSMAAIQTRTPLRSYTWRCDEWFDQGREGACVGFAIGHELAARPAEVKGITPRYLREKIYWAAQRIDPWAGGAYPDASQRYEGTSVLAGVKIAQQLGHIEEYRWAFNTNDALHGIGHNGPALIGVKWYAGMSYPDSNHFIRPIGRLQGGHCILVRAVNVKKEFVTLRNTWGPNWADNGDCYMTFADFNTILQDSGECVFMLNRRTRLRG